MSRAVVPVRLSDKEREQIASAALRQGLSFSGFLRAASLEASARVMRKVVPAREPAPRPMPKPAPIAVIDEAEPQREHWCDGERVDLLQRAAPNR